MLYECIATSQWWIATVSMWKMTHRNSGAQSIRIALRCASIFHSSAANAFNYVVACWTILSPSFFVFVSFSHPDSFLSLFLKYEFVEQVTSNRYLWGVLFSSCIVKSSGLRLSFSSYPWLELSIQPKPHFPNKCFWRSDLSLDSKLPKEALRSKQNDLYLVELYWINTDA